MEAGVAESLKSFHLLQEVFPSPPTAVCSDLSFLQSPRLLAGGRAPQHSPPTPLSCISSREGEGVGGRGSVLPCPRSPPGLAEVECPLLSLLRREVENCLHSGNPEKPKLGASWKGRERVDGAAGETPVTSTLPRDWVQPVGHGKSRVVLHSPEKAPPHSREARVPRLSRPHLQVCLFLMNPTSVACTCIITPGKRNSRSSPGGWGSREAPKTLRRALDSPVHPFPLANVETWATFAAAKPDLHHSSQSLA